MQRCALGSWNLIIIIGIPSSAFHLPGLEARGRERQWVRHQTSGDVDEGKLIEGVTGEKAVYRRRADKEPDAGAPQLKPKK